MHRFVDRFDNFRYVAIDVIVNGMDYGTTRVIVQNVVIVNDRVVTSVDGVRHDYELNVVIAIMSVVCSAYVFTYVRGVPVEFCSFIVRCPTVRKTIGRFPIVLALKGAATFQNGHVQKTA